MEVGKFSRTASYLLLCMVGDFREPHGTNHVSGRVKTGDSAACVAVEMHYELALTDVANESVGEGRLNFRVFVHPLLANKLAVFYNQRPGCAQFVV